MSDVDRLISGPTKIEDDWRSFKEAGFTTIPIILPDRDNQDRAYFPGDIRVSICLRMALGILLVSLLRCCFSNLINVLNVEIIDGPKPIHGNWSLPLVASPA